MVTNVITMYVSNPKYMLIKHLDEITSEVHIWKDDNLECVYTILFFTKYSNKNYSGMFEDGKDLTVHFSKIPKETEMVGVLR